MILIGFTALVLNLFHVNVLFEHLGLITSHIDEDILLKSNIYVSFSFVLRSIFRKRLLPNLGYYGKSIVKIVFVLLHQTNSFLPIICFS